MMNVFLFLIPAIIIGSFGSILLKKGSANVTLEIKNLITNYTLFLGLFLFGLSTLFYINALRFGNLSVVYPLSSFTYVVMSFLSVYLLKEKMNKLKWLGIIFIIIGAFLIV